MKLKTQLKKEIAKDRLEQVIDQLLELKNIGKSTNKQIILIAQRFYKWKKNKHSGEFTSEQLDASRVRISSTLLDIVDSLTENNQSPKRKRSLFSFLQFSQSNTPTETDAFTQEKDKIRDYLIERYTERLRQKTDHRLPVSLQLTYSKEGTSSDYAHFSKDIRLSEPIEGNLVQTLQKHRHLLIIGNPGAGKTTQILDLAKEWLTERTDKKLPIVFNLASWKSENNRFHEWLQDALVSGYGFSKKLAQEAILTNQILPLLDGLDEVGKDLENEDEQQNIRNLCLEAIDDYLGLLEVEYVVICSRRKEYSEIEVNAPVKAEVLVNPLTPEQIKATLKDSLTKKLSTRDENAANTLLSLLKQNPVLEEVLCTPFYYNIALEVFDSRSYNQNLPATKARLEGYLVEQFIAEKLRDTSNRKGFLKEKTLGYLGWIGGMMNGEGKVVFELVSFQYFHLEKPWKIVITHNLVVGLILSFIGGLVIVLDSLKNLIIGFTFVFIFSLVALILCLVFGLILGLILCLVSGLFFFLDRNGGSIFLVKPRDIRTIHWSNLWLFSTWITSLKISFSFSLLGSLTTGLIGSLFSDLEGGLFFGLVMGVVVGLLMGLREKLIQVSFFFSIKTSYYRFKSEIIVSVFQTMLILMISFLTVLYIDESTGVLYNMLILIPLCFIGGVVATSLFNHSILRLCLFLEKKLPLQLVHFLQYATQARILEQDGGQWRFRHQILQDYFAERYDSGVNRNG